MPDDLPRPDELRITGITKSYPGVRALDGVDLAVQRGTIHAIAGQNGAGKSTLVRILAGAEMPDRGAIYVAGQRARFHSPQDAQAAGIQTIYQELSLIPHLSVAENIFLGDLPRKIFPGVDWPGMRRQAQEVLARVGFDLDVRRPVSSFSVAEQQGIEIAKALHKQARVVLLDEPTSALPPPDVQRLFKLLRALASDGVTMLYISHRIQELYELCEYVTVLRDGRKVGTFATATSEPADVVTAMVGKGLAGSLEGTALTGASAAQLGFGRIGPVLLSVRGLGDGHTVSGVSFDLHKGEVLGITGLVGAGQSELVTMLAGAGKRAAGAMLLDGRPVKVSSPREAIRCGIGLLPQDRRAHGFIPELSVAGNITLANLPAFSSLSVRSGKKEASVAREFAQRLDMRIASIAQPMQTLSGGTQQKVILARWLVRQVRILICDEPTRGVDVGAKEEIYELIRDFVRDGGTVILASSELNEAIMCDRVLVMSRGKLVKTVENDDLDPHGKSILQHIA